MKKLNLGCGDDYRALCKWTPFVQTLTFYLRRR
jgi:hypothetical protein